MRSVSACWLVPHAFASASSSGSPSRVTSPHGSSGAFAPGAWLGVELVLPVGKHDGAYKGERYFKCAPRRGLFVRPTAAQPFDAGAMTRVYSPTNRTFIEDPLDIFQVTRLKTKASLQDL